MTTDGDLRWKEVDTRTRSARRVFRLMRYQYIELGAYRWLSTMYTLEWKPVKELWRFYCTLPPGYQAGQWRPKTSFTLDMPPDLTVDEAKRFAEATYVLRHSVT